MAKIWHALLCSFLTEDVGAESHVRKHHSAEELAVDGSAELSTNFLASVNKIPASLVREARRPKHIEVDTFGIARNSDNFVDSTHVLVRDAKDDVKTIDDFAFSAPNLSSIVVRKALDEQVTAKATSETKHEAMEDVDVLSALEQVHVKKAGGWRWLPNWRQRRCRRKADRRKHCCNCRDKIRKKGWCVTEDNLDRLSQNDGIHSCKKCRCGESKAELVKMCKDEGLLCKTETCVRYEETYSKMCRYFPQGRECKSKGEHLMSNRKTGGAGNGGTCWYECCEYELSSLVEVADSNRPSLLKSRAGIPISNDSKQTSAVSLHETQVEELDESVQRKCR